MLLIDPDYLLRLLEERMASIAFQRQDEMNEYLNGYIDGFGEAYRVVSRNLHGIWWDDCCQGEYPDRTDFDVR